MTAGDLYAEIKAALKYFEVPFGKMDEVTVTRTANALIFRHEGASVTFAVPAEKPTE